MDDYDPNKESLYLMYWDVNNLDGWAMFQVNGFEWDKNNSNFNKNLKITRHKISGIGYFLNLMLDVLNNYANYKMLCQLYQKE